MTASLPIQSAQALRHRRAHALLTARWGFLLLCGLAVASGVVVLIEPAPYDLAIVALLAVAVASRRFVLAPVHYGPLLLLTVFFAANAVSLTGALEVKTGIAYFAVSAYLVLSAFFVTGIAGAHGSRGVKVLLRAYTVAGWVSAALAALAFFGVLPFHDTLLLYGRARGLFKDPNVYGPYLVPVFLVGLASLQRAKGFTRALAALAGCGLTVTGIFLSFSRAAWLNCGISAAAFLALQFVYGIRTRNVPARLLWPLASVPLLFAGLALVANQGGLSRLLDDRLGDNGLHRYDDDRFATQQKGLQAVLTQPLGIGSGQSEDRFNYSTHSMYVRILTENGFVGFAAFYAFVLWSWLRATKLALTLRDRYSRDVFTLASAAILGLLINGLVIDTNHWRNFWFLLGLAWWVPRAISDQRSSLLRVQS